jgi:hypothetical protein
MVLQELHDQIPIELHVFHDEDLFHGFILTLLHMDVDAALPKYPAVPRCFQALPERNRPGASRCLHGEGCGTLTSRAQ